jgi:hypothetical protein
VLRPSMLYHLRGDVCLTRTGETLKPDHIPRRGVFCCWIQPSIEVSSFVNQAPVPSQREVWMRSRRAS